MNREAIRAYIEEVEEITKRYEPLIIGPKAIGAEPGTAELLGKGAPGGYLVLIAYQEEDGEIHRVTSMSGSFSFMNYTLAMTLEKYHDKTIEAILKEVAKL